MGGNPKKASDSDPLLKDQGIDYVTAAGAAGQGQQSCIFAMPGSGGAFTFAGAGLKDMATATYRVVVGNNTSAARPATVTAKTVSGFTLTGPSAADSLDIIISGPIKGQVF